MVKTSLNIVGHNGSGFDSCVVSNNPPQWRTAINLIKNGSSVVSLKIFNRYVNKNKKNPQKVNLRSGRVRINISLKIRGISYKLQPSFLQKEMNHDVICEDTWEDKEHEWLPYLK